MAAPSRRWQLAGLSLLTLGFMACNPLMLPYFMFVGPDPKNDAEFKLVGEDKHQPIKVLVLTSTPLETRPELLGSDRELAGLFSQKLQAACKENKENVVLASASKVQKFRDEHPNWRSMGLADLGKRLDADYVIDLEINHMTLYEPGSGNTLLLGRADISVTVANVHKDDEEAVYRKEYACEYPHSGSRSVTDISLTKFRRDFLTRMAMDLTWIFSAHPSSDEHNCD